MKEWYGKEEVQENMRVELIEWIKDVFISCLPKGIVFGMKDEGLKLKNVLYGKSDNKCSE